MAYQPSTNTHRLTYGGQPYANEEAARQELFADAGPGPSGAPAQGYASAYEDNPQQMLADGINQHKDTTASAKRALQIVQNTNQVADDALAAMHDQRQQMAKIDDDMTRLGTDLSYSERLLRFMRMCCCFGFFCSCCTEPERNKHDSHWREQSGGFTGPARQQQSQQQQQQQKGKQKGQPAPPAPEYPKVNTEGLPEDARQVIDAETAQQDHYLDQISRGLDQLKVKAQEMNQEVGRQEGSISQLAMDSVALNDRLRNVNRAGMKV